MIFDPSNMEQRRVLAEQLLRDLVYGLEQLAREQGYLQHCINLKFSVAASHIRTLEVHDSPQAASRGAKREEESA